MLFPVKVVRLSLSLSATQSVAVQQYESSSATSHEWMQHSQMIDCGMYRRSRANDLAPAVDKNGLLTSNAALSMSDTFSFLFAAAISPETRY